jgi:adenosylcobinamide-phosphate synthase
MTTTRLSTGAILSVDDDRVRVDVPLSPHHFYRSLSSAILNGGDHAFSSRPPTTSLPLPTTTTSPSTPHYCRVINRLVPPTCDGLSPPPLELLAKFAAEEPGGPVDLRDTIGLLTAASMKTCSTSSRSAMGMTVDVIVTAGLSNARSAGADADYFVVARDGDDTDDDDDDGGGGDGGGSSTTTAPPQPPAGTINTIVIVGGETPPLSPAARVEAYAIAIEAKCGACVDHGVVCAKDPTRGVASGTGTDCCVLICPATDHDGTTMREEGGGKRTRTVAFVEHAGKHTLLGELIGQAVREATSRAIMVNVRHLHGNYAIYALRRWAQVLASTAGGARPIVPPMPMMPVPLSPPSIVAVGVCAVLAMYAIPSPSSFRADGARLLLAAVAWDRYLGEPPLRLHPVCIAGSAIGLSLKLTPNRALRSPALGFACGLLLLAAMVVAFVSGALVYIRLADAMAGYGSSTSIDDNDDDGSGERVCVGGLNDEHHWHCTNTPLVKLMLGLSSWMLKVVLLKSTFSLQLLLSISLQMAHYLERDQIREARSQLSWLCSRDPSALCASDLAGATLESLSENLSDGFVAPLFWYAILGGSIPGALGYRVVNTLDSRIGYRGRYEWYGKASARFDDLVNIVPARITALLLAAAALFVRGGVRGISARDGLRTAWVDSSQCDSPNAGWPMACFAGVLGVRLKKERSYCLGASGMNPGPANIRDGHRVAQIAGGFFILLAVLLVSVIKR